VAAAFDDLNHALVPIVECARDLKISEQEQPQIPVFAEGLLTSLKHHFPPTDPLNGQELEFDWGHTFPTKFEQY
jgi:hypothetical protein